MSAPAMLPFSQIFRPMLDRCVVQPLEADIFRQNGIIVNALRLDLIDPLVGGNKLFKLLPFLEEAVSVDAGHIVTCGGPFSNHIVAAARACELLGLKLTVIVRGHPHMRPTPVMQMVTGMGAFIIVSGSDDFSEMHYRQGLQPDGSYHIPMGGWSEKGVRGAGLMAGFIPSGTTHLVLAAGTGTTVAGLALARPDLNMEAVVVTNLDEVKAQVEQIVPTGSVQFHINKELHSYARKFPALPAFLHIVEAGFSLPLDFVYTARAFHWMLNAAESGYFPPGAQIGFLHTGGLTGNLGLTLS